MILENISSPADLKSLDESRLTELADEIRARIISVVSQNGGHLASNLGVVELTLALHRVLDSPKDRIIFDVGHQCYTHKLLTGRYNEFETLRRTNGISGFPRAVESEHDFFGSAHSSNSVSVAIGMATAAKLSGSDTMTVAVIGDGAFTGGMVYEALNNCVDKKLRLVIVLNDNEMSISHNVGAIDNYFSRFRASSSYFSLKNRFVSMTERLPGNAVYKALRAAKNRLKRLVLKENLFELFDLEYYGPLDGNNEKQLETVFSELKNHRHGIAVVHIKTKKGLGYPPAEQNPDVYHSVGSFDIAKGAATGGKEKTFSYNFGKALAGLAEENEKLCAVTAAMAEGTGLDRFRTMYPDRFFDVGIAEEHAATFCGGLSSGGMLPVFAVYSTFMQRCFDQLLMDVALQGQSIVLGIDRAGLVGDDGPTHHGVFDVSLLSGIPDALVFSPAFIDELKPCLEKCIVHKGVSALRYPRGGEWQYDKTSYSEKNGVYYADYGTPEVCIITYGRLTAECDKAARLCGRGVRVIRLLRILPPDTDTVYSLSKDMKYVLFAEEGIRNGGVGEKLTASLRKRGINADVAAIDGFAPHGTNADVLDTVGLSAKKLAEVLKNA